MKNAVRFPMLISSFFEATTQPNLELKREVYENITEANFRRILKSKKQTKQDKTKEISAKL